LILEEKRASNIYKDFPILFKLLDFNDAMNVLNSFFSDRGRNIDYDSGNISSPKKKSITSFYRIQENAFDIGITL